MTEQNSKEISVLHPSSRTTNDTTRVDKDLQLLFTRKVFKLKQMDTIASPGPVSLFGFGFACLLLGVSNAGWFGLSPAVLAVGFSFAGVIFCLTGIIEWVKGSTFNSLVFISYSMFWMSFVFIPILAQLGLAPPPDSNGMAWYLFIWGIFTIGNCIACFNGSKILFAIFVLVATLIELIAAAQWTGSSAAIIASGALAIAIGFLAIYAAAAAFINEIYGRAILPMFVPDEKICK